MSDQDKHPTVHMKCKRGSDQRTAGTSCSSMKAYKLSKDGDQIARFKCAECGHMWQVAVGGQFNVV